MRGCLTPSEMALPTNIVVVNWTLLPFELWDYVFRYHVVDEYDALRLAQTCTTRWEVYKSNGAKEWAWRNRWIREVQELDKYFEHNWKGTRRCSDDKKEGAWRMWYDNGQLRWESHWVDGKRHGFRGWYDDGQLHWESQCVYGKQHGFDWTWYDNGQLFWEIHWVDGKKHGMEYVWNQNGVMRYKINWVHGVRR